MMGSVKTVSRAGFACGTVMERGECFLFCKLTEGEVTVKAACPSGYEDEESPANRFVNRTVAGERRLRQYEFLGLGLAGCKRKTQQRQKRFENALAAWPPEILTSRFLLPMRWGNSINFKQRVWLEGFRNLSLESHDI